MRLYQPGGPPSGQKGISGKATAAPEAVSMRKNNTDRLNII
jgi:hypothetical protein